METQDIKAITSVHCDHLEIEWVPFDASIRTTAHFSVRARSVHTFMHELSNIITTGYVEVMEGAELFYVWCKIPTKG